ncbi:MAG: SDR family oxidoreductase [Bacteroidales bacterium]|jgi:short-subunit dehydrogenase|nr:SDR family oxidoreductase [Bacteroidales bacterium]
MQKIILITGASSGFGKVTASYLAGKGHIVFGTSRKKKENPDFQMLEMDVTRKDTIRSCIRTIIEQYGKIDVLINNAGVGVGGVLEYATEEEIDIQIRTNLIGVMNVCSEILPYFREQKGGVIINVSSLAGLMGIPYQGLYSVSKFGIEGYSEALSLEVNQFNIKVVIVEPGDFRTNFTSNRIISDSLLHDEAYRLSFENVLKVIEKEESNGLDPILFAKKINAIIHKKNPKFRYSIAKAGQKVSIYAKKILPARLFQKFLSIYYKVAVSS